MVFVYLAGAGIITYLAVRGRTVEVPNVIGKSREAARQELDESGLRMNVKNEAPNDKTPKDAVIDQSPSAGKIVKTGQIVRVTLSLGAAAVGQNPQK